MTDKLTALYEYQVMELELAAIESQFKETDTRKLLLLRQKYLQDASNMTKKIEHDILVRNDIISETESTIEKLKEQNAQLVGKIALLNDITDMEEVKTLIKECDNITDTVAKAKKRMSEVKRESEKAEEELKNLFPKMSKAKKEFDALKVVYSKEMENTSPQLEELRRKADEAAKKLDPALLAKYRAIKKTLKDPVAVISDSKCSGCNMQLPSGNLAAIKAASKAYECDNCGRILIVK